MLFKRNSVNKPKTRYYVHVRFDYEERLFQTLGPYRWKFLAELDASMVLNSHPLAESTVNTDKEFSFLTEDDRQWLQARPY